MREALLTDTAEAQVVLICTHTFANIQFNEPDVPVPTKQQKIHTTQFIIRVSSGSRRFSSPFNLWGKSQKNTTEVSIRENL